MRNHLSGKSFSRPVRLLGVTLATLALALSGACQQLMPDADEEVLPVNKYGFIDNNDYRYVESPDNSRHLIEAEGEVPKPEEYIEKAGQLARKEQPIPEPAREKPVNRYYEDFIVLNADEMLDVSLTFNTTPLIDVLPAFADILGFNFSADNDIKNTITVNINSMMTRRELWELFDATMRMAGVAVLRSGNSLRIMPAAKVPSQPDLRVNNRADGSAEVMTFNLKYVTPSEVQRYISTFLTRNASVVIPIPRQNILMVSDLSDNLVKIKMIVEALDQPGRNNWPRAVIYCHNVKASRVAQDLYDILPTMGLPVRVQIGNIQNIQDQPGGYIYMNAIDRVQLLIVSAATEEVIEEIRNWVNILDTADPVDQERVYIYKIAHSKAQQLIQAVSAIFYTQSTSTYIDLNSGNQRNERINADQTRTSSSVNTTQAGNNRYTTNSLLNIQTDRESSIFDQPIRVFADGVHNRLVIRCTPRAYAVIKAMLDRLDVVPGQVLLQVLVAEIKLTDGNEFGVEWNAFNSGSQVGTSVGQHYNGSGYNDPTSEGFKFGIFDPDRPDETFAFIRALATKDKVKIISSPQLLVTSNTEAMIQVGEEVPLLKSDVSDTQNPTTTQRTYEYKNTGVILTITPQVTSTDQIALELKQEISTAVKNTLTTATDTPLIQQRVLETSMSIANGRTMIIGGIIQEKSTDELQSVPFLANIPFIGRLIGNTNASIERTELLVLITGYIVNEQSPVKEMVRRYNEAVKALSLFEEQIIEAGEADKAKVSAKVENPASSVLTAE